MLEELSYPFTQKLSLLIPFNFHFVVLWLVSQPLRVIVYFLHRFVCIIVASIQLLFIEICIMWCTWKSGHVMMTSSNGNIFRVTGHLCGEFTGPRWIPRTKASDAELRCAFNKRLSKQSWGWWFETPLCPLWRHCNVTSLCGLHCCSALDWLYHTLASTTLSVSCVSA